MKGILFIDRNEDVLVTMKVFLEKQGFFCFPTSSYDRAFELLSMISPDLILLDFTDENQGYSMLLKLKNHSLYRTIPLIITLARHQLLKFPETPHIRKIEKPFNLLELHRLLNSIA
jgi:DNA-binding response OmpR family regulator